MCKTTLAKIGQLAVKYFKSIYLYVIFKIKNLYTEKLKMRVRVKMEGTEM